MLRSESVVRYYKQIVARGVAFVVVEAATVGVVVNVVTTSWRSVRASMD